MNHNSLTSQPYTYFILFFGPLEKYGWPIKLGAQHVNRLSETTIEDNASFTQCVINYAMLCARNNALLVYGGYTPETTCLTAVDLKEVATRIKNIRST